MSEDDQTSILKVLVQLRDEVTDPLKQVNDRFSEMAENFASIGMAAGEVFAGYEALNQVIEPAAEMQDRMVGLKEATLANADALDKYKQQADEIGSSMPLAGGAEEALQAMTELYKTFRDDKSLEEQTETAAKLAVVMGDTAPMSAKVLSSAVMNLGDTSRPATEQMKEFGDEIAVLQARFPMGSGGLMRMAMALRMLGSAAKVNNVNQKEMFAIMAEGNRISLGGPRGSGPILAAIVNSLLKMKDGRYELEKYGHFVEKTADGHVNLIKTLENLSNMNDKQRRTLEGSMGAQGANVSLLISHMGDLKEAYNEIDHAQGQLDQDAKDRTATFNAQMQEMKNSWQETKESIGKHLLPGLTDDLRDLKGITDELNKLSEDHPILAGIAAKTMEWSAGIAAVLGGLKLLSVALNFAKGLTIINMMTTAMFGFQSVTAGAATAGEALSLVFASNPLGWVVLALAGLVAIAEALYHIKDIEEAMGLHPGAHMKPGLPVHPFDKEHYDPRFAASPDVLARVHMAEHSDISHQIREMETHLHYMEGATVSVQVGTGVDGQQVGSAVRGALDQHTDNLMRFLHDIKHDDARRSFGNPALEGAR